jgi:hypothetical protein
MRLQIDWVEAMVDEGVWLLHQVRLILLSAKHDEG